MLYIISIILFILGVVSFGLVAEADRREKSLTRSAYCSMLWCKVWSAVKSGCVSVKKGWLFLYPHICNWLEQYRRERRARLSFWEDLEYELLSILAEYSFPMFRPDVILYQLPLPSYIYMSMTSKHTQTTEVAQEVLGHLVAKVQSYLNAYGCKVPIFPYFTINGTTTEFFIYYCEYEQEIADFNSRVSSIILSQTSCFGTLAECNIPKSSEVLIGYNAESWDNGGLVSPFIWKWKKNPHLLISGQTGGGKSVMCQLIVKQLLEQGADLTVCDFKAGGDWDKVGSEYAEYTACGGLLEKFYNEFLKTIESKAYCEKYLLFDEFSSFAQSLGKKDYEKMIEQISHIAFMGRSFGFHLILVSQQFNASVLPTSVREQFATRVYMGSRIYTESATMLFPNTTIDKSVALPEYHGYIATPDTDLATIVIPKIESPLSLKQQLVELSKQKRLDCGA